LIPVHARKSCHLYAPNLCTIKAVIFQRSGFGALILINGYLASDPPK
jgi:hypothetical protein